MSTELPIHFEPDKYQQRTYQRWLDSGALFAAPDERDGKYVIMMPLPNVTGALHMGHAMNNVMQDMLVRWHRMMGDNTLWMPGTDHAGIATQAVVEKRLFELEGKTRHDIGRKALIDRIWAWKDEYQKRIIEQLQSMGCSCDWGRLRFTMDDVCTVAVREAFFRLFKDGLIFRGNRLVNWDCFLQTAISDDEIVRETVQGHFWHIRYPIINPGAGEPEHLVVATTRPETMLGDTAVACHPDPQSALERTLRNLKERISAASRKEKPQLEEEYERIEARRQSHLPILLTLRDMALDGRKALLPLMNREIPLILDEWAKPELGSGVVKVTPAHDPNDYDVWQRHQDKIEIVNILNPDGSLNDNAGDYSGLDRFDAREKILDDLRSQGLVEATEDREIEVGHSDRSKTIVEPYLSKQWFISMGDVKGGVTFGRGTKKEFKAPGLAQAAIDAVSEEWRSPSGRNLTFHPDPVRYGSTFRNWLAEKRDWCISRQLWWGHRIPIWHGSISSTKAKELFESVVKANPGELWGWIADADGRLTDAADISRNKSDSVEMLVCIRTPEAEGKFAAALEGAGLARDPDVLDTWFSSSLWPFSTLGWPNPNAARVEPDQDTLGAGDGRKDYLSYFYPGSCLVTGRDIITLWVARMQLMGLYFLGDVPFTDCFIYATIQDGKGERMSKSKGNGIDPVDIIESYGADAMRYVLCEMQTGTQDIRLPVQAVSPYTGELVELATAKHGRSIFTYICPQTGKEFDVLGTMKDIPAAKIISERFEIGRAFCTKLWNAVRFALMNLGQGSEEFIPLDLRDLAVEDTWILSRLSKVAAEVTKHLEAYNPSAAIGAARDFFWGELCDWYLEMIKPRFSEQGKDALIARGVLAFTIDQVLRLFHPFVPFITETLWQRLNEQFPARGIDSQLPASELLIRADWPQSNPNWQSKRVENDFDLLREIVRAIRDLRSRYNVPPSKKLEAHIKTDGENADRLTSLQHLLKHMAGLETLEISGTVERPALAAAQVVGNMEIYLVGALNPEKERERLLNQKEKILEDLQRSERKLSNRNFVERAPKEVVDSEQKKLLEFRNQIGLIDKNLAALEQE